MAKDEQINIRLTRDEKKQLLKDAHNQERPISNLLLWCWKQWREAEGGKNGRRPIQKRQLSS
jgi:hypothetical protein